MSIIIPGEIAKISSRVDKTISVHFNTQELNEEEAGKLFSLRGKYVKAFFTEKGIIHPEIQEAIETEEIQDSRKKYTKSQLLRFALMRLHKHEDPTTKFEDYYQKKMSEIIDHFDKKLT